MKGGNFLDIASAGLDGIPHDLLVGLIAGVGGVTGIAAVRPGLHPAETGVWLVGADGVDEQREPRFVRAADTAVVARLLEGDIVVAAVSEGLAEGDRVFNNTILGDG